MMGLPKEEAQDRFALLLDAFSDDPPMAASCSVGTGSALLSGTDSIRDVIASPKSVAASIHSPAPSSVTAEQRQEVGITSSPTSERSGV